MCFCNPSYLRHPDGAVVLAVHEHGANLWRCLCVQAKSRYPNSDFLALPFIFKCAVKKACQEVIVINSITTIKLFIVDRVARLMMPLALPWCAYPGYPHCKYKSSGVLNDRKSYPGTRDSSLTGSGNGSSTSSDRVLLLLLVSDQPKSRRGRTASWPVELVVPGYRGTRAGTTQLTTPVVPGFAGTATTTVWMPELISSTGLAVSRSTKYSRRNYSYCSGCELSIHY
eukprot:2848145-Rhodomonas_salina.2